MKRQTIKIMCVFMAVVMLLSFCPAFGIRAEAYTESDWVLASQLPSGAEVTARKWTYTKTTYTDSRETSLSGYTCTGSEWIPNGSGSARYAPDLYPGFNENGYISFTTSCPYKGEETATSRRAVTTAWAGYVYWHWMYEIAGCNKTDTQNSGLSRRFSLKKGDYRKSSGYSYANYTVFNYFLSTVNCPIASGRGYCEQDRTCVGYDCFGQYNSWRVNDGQRRFYRFDYYTATYQDYYKLFHYSKTENLESSTAISSSSSSTQVISNVKEYVKYKKSFTISYNANGGSGAPAAQTKTYGVDLTLSQTKPSRPGYDFLGWSTSPTALDASYSPGQAFKSNGDYTLYAVWKEKPKFTVSYNYSTNGGTSASSGAVKVYRDDSANLSVTASRSGWTFVGWNTDPNAVSGLKSLTVTRDVTLYAIFSKTVTASFYAESQTLHATKVSTFYNQASSCTISLPQVPSYQDWNAVSWVRAADKKEYTPGATFSISGNETFYAKYSKNLTLSYNANGGSSTPASQTVARYWFADGHYEENKPVLASGIKREGYNFAKWAMNSASGTAYAAGDTVEITANTVMYATWTKMEVLKSPQITVKSAATGKTVEISGAPEGAEIHYTTDGSSPTKNSPVYTSAIQLTTAGTYAIKALCTKASFSDSPVVVQEVTVSQAAQVAASAASGSIRYGTEITLTTSTAGATIYYTTDGSTPSTKSAVYTTPFVMRDSFTLKAIAAAPGYAISKRTDRTYELAPIYSVDEYGFQFVNAAASFGYTSVAPSLKNYCIPYSSVMAIFGDTVKAKQVYSEMALQKWNGNCCGMASASSLMYEQSSKIHASDFGQQSVHALRITDKAGGDLTVRTFIEALQTSQKAIQFASELDHHKRTNKQLAGSASLNELLSEVTADLSRGKNAVIAIGRDGMGAHALLAYETVPVSATETRIYVYDCNNPDDPDRYVTLYADAGGRISRWSYDMLGRNGVWGTGSGGGFISYVTYDTIAYIWDNRGHLYDDYLTLSIASNNAAIYDLKGNEVGRVENGVFISERDDVFEVPELSLSTGSGNLNIYLPEDFYIVNNLDGGTFTASMVGELLGSTVTTNSDAVCFGIDEALFCNEVSIEQAGANTSYTISLDSCIVGTNREPVFDNITISGTGTGKNMTLQNSASGGMYIANSNIESYMVNGVEQINYVISASAGSNGTISPKGDQSVPAATNMTYTITPDEGYRVRDVIVDGYSIGPESEYTFENVGRDHMIRATFEKAYALDGISVSGSSLLIQYSSASAAALLTAVYSADGQLLTSAVTDVFPQQTSIRINLSAPLPEHYSIKAFLLSGDGAQTPLCASISRSR